MTDTILPLSLREIVNNAWQKVKGSKKTIWLSFTIVAIATAGLTYSINPIAIHFPLFGIAFNIVSNSIIVLLQAGLLYIGIQRALDQPISFRMIFRGFQLKLGMRILGFYLLKFLIIFPFFFLIGITVGMTIAAFSTNELFLKIAMVTISSLVTLSLVYVLTRLFLGMGLVIDKNINPWQAVKLSFSATRLNTFNIIYLFCIEACILIISLFPFGLGLIWGLPFILILYGMTYRKLSLNLPSEPYPKDAALFYYLNKKFTSGIS